MCGCGCASALFRVDKSRCWLSVKVSKCVCEKLENAYSFLIFLGLCRNPLLLLHIQHLGQRNGSVFHQELVKGRDSVGVELYRVQNQVTEHVNWV